MTLLTNTGQIVSTHRSTFRTAAVKRTRDVEAMMAAATIADGTLVDVYGENV